jgi:hypothetical protein
MYILACNKVMENGIADLRRKKAAIFSVSWRVARWFLLEPKIPIWAYFGGL